MRTCFSRRRVSALYSVTAFLLMIDVCVFVLMTSLASYLFRPYWSFSAASELKSFRSLVLASFLVLVHN